MRSGNSTVSTRPPSAPVLRMRLIPAPERGGSMQCRGTASPCPSAGRMSPTSQRLFQPRPHAVTSRRDRAANVRAGVPSAGEGVRGGRQLVEPCAPLFTIAPLGLTYLRRCSESRQVERPRTRQWSSRGSAGHRFVQCCPAELDGWAESMRPLVMVSLAGSISGPACGGPEPGTPGLPRRRPGSVCRRHLPASEWAGSEEGRPLPATLAMTRIPRRLMQ